MNVVEPLNQDGQPSRERWTVRSLLAWCAPWLAERGVDSPRLDAELLLAHALGVRRLDLFLDPDRPLGSAELAAFKALIKRRAAREPVAYILKERAFWRHTFGVRSGVLIPRPETERLVEVVLERHPDRPSPLHLLEMGVGSGAVLLSLLLEYPNAYGVGSDLSAVAVGCARANALKLGLEERVEFLTGDLFAVLPAAARFDVIVANPPYVSTGEYADLEPEVREWEPPDALLAGNDGLEVIRRLVPGALPFLKEGGMLALEMGWQQGEGVAALFREAGFLEVRVLQDYGQRDRVVTGIAPPREEG